MIEHEEPAFEAVRQSDRANVNAFLAQRSILAGEDRSKGIDGAEEGDGSFADFQDYVNLPATWQWGPQYDVILLLGPARVACAKSVIRNSLLTPAGVVLVPFRVMPEALRQDFKLIAPAATAHGPSSEHASYTAMLRPELRTGVLPRQQPVVMGVRYSGSRYGGWTYNASRITPDAVVYSVGIGEDASWDMAMLADHGVRVWGFDPTSKAATYVQTHAIFAIGSDFTQEGLGLMKGMMEFTKPLNPEHVSMRVGNVNGMGETISVPINTLNNWMGERGHAYLNLLKIDIESSEYAVLEDWIARRWFPMDQLLVEFHPDTLSDQGRHDRVLSGLNTSGFVVSAVSDNKKEYLFEKQFPKSMLVNAVNPEKIWSVGRLPASRPRSSRAAAAKWSWTW